MHTLRLRQPKTTTKLLRPRLTPHTKRHIHIQIRVALRAHTAQLTRQTKRRIRHKHPQHPLRTLRKPLVKRSVLRFTPRTHAIRVPHHQTHAVLGTSLQTTQRRQRVTRHPTLTLHTLKRSATPRAARAQKTPYVRLRTLANVLPATRAHTNTRHTRLARATHTRPRTFGHASRHVALPATRTIRRNHQTRPQKRRLRRTRHRTNRQPQTHSECLDINTLPKIACIYKKLNSSCHSFALSPAEATITQNVRVRTIANVLATLFTQSPLFKTPFTQTVRLRRTCYVRTALLTLSLTTHHTTPSMLHFLSQIHLDNRRACAEKRVLPVRPLHSLLVLAVIARSTYRHQVNAATLQPHVPARVSRTLASCKRTKATLATRVQLPASNPTLPVQLVVATAIHVPRVQRLLQHLNTARGKPQSQRLAPLSRRSTQIRHCKHLTEHQTHEASRPSHPPSKHAQPTPNPRQTTTAARTPQTP